MMNISQNNAINERNSQYLFRVKETQHDSSSGQNRKAQVPQNRSEFRMVLNICKMHAKWQLNRIELEKIILFCTSLIT